MERSKNITYSSPRRFHLDQQAHQEFGARLATIVGTLHVFNPRVMTAKKVREILDLPEPQRKKDAIRDRFLRPENSNGTKDSIPLTRRKVQKAAREASRVWEDEEGKVEEKTKKARFALPIRQEVKGNEKSIKANREWPTPIQKEYEGLRKVGLKFKILRVNGKQRRLSIVIPENWATGESTLTIPDPILEELEQVGLKDSPSVLKSLAYFYGKLRKEANKRRRQKERRHGRKQSRKREVERIQLHELTGYDEEDFSTEESAQSLSAYEGKDDDEEVIGEYRDFCWEEGVDSDEVEVVVEMGEKDPSLLKAMMRMRWNLTEWRDSAKDTEWRLQKARERNNHQALLQENSSAVDLSENDEDEESDLFETMFRDPEEESD